MTAIFAESVLAGDILETCDASSKGCVDTLLVECIHWTEYGIMFQGREHWSERLVTLLPVPATALVEVWSR
jgi:hypothetical protein